MKKISSIFLLLFVQGCWLLHAQTPLIINEIMSANVDQFLSPVWNFNGWIELYNPSEESVSLNSIYVSDEPANLKKWKSPATMGEVAPHDYFVLWFADTETSPSLPNFKLDVDGGQIILSDAGGRILTSMAYPSIPARSSYARVNTNSDDWLFASEPSPGTPNEIESLTANKQLQSPDIHPHSQVFSETIDATVEVPEGCTLRYTTDGSTPTMNNGATSTDGCFHFSETTILRLRLFAPSYLPSDVTTVTFLHNQDAINDEGAKVSDLTLPILSVVGDDHFFYDPEIGIMVDGTNGIPGNGTKEPRNWNRDWQRPVGFSLINSQGEELTSHDALLEIAGGWSRARYPKPFKLKGNKVFGHGKTLNYPYFDAKPFIRNRTLLFRNGGNDSISRIKDAFLQTFVQRSGINIDLQSYQPVVHFINGKYCGLLNMREPSNKHYVYANYGWDDDEIDFFEINNIYSATWNCGDKRVWLQLVMLSERASEEESYQKIRQLIDIDEFINYMAIETFLGNTDWISNNIKGFRNRDGGRFRFILFDLDGAFVSSSILNTFIRRNRDTSEFVQLFYNLMANDTFRRRFLDTFCIISSSVFEYNNIVPQIRELSERVHETLGFEGLTPETMASTIRWTLYSYATQTAEVLSSSEFLDPDTTEFYHLEITSAPQNATVLLNDIPIPHAHFKGWALWPVRLEAKTLAGYVFQGWLDNKTNTIFSAESIIKLPHQDMKLTPLYVALSNEERRRRRLPDIVINEISASNHRYDNDYFKRASWIELLNTTDHEIDISNLFLSDDPSNLQKYQIVIADDSHKATIPPQGHRVVWCDGKVSMGQPHAPSMLSASGGSLFLTNEDMKYVDKIVYPAHNANTTVGRFPDGANEWFIMDIPTIEEPNMHTSYLERIEMPEPPTSICKNEYDNSLTIHHCKDYITVTDKDKSFPTIDVSIYNASGTTLYKSTHPLTNGSATISLEQLPKGCHVIKVSVKGIHSISCAFTL